MRLSGPIRTLLLVAVITAAAFTSSAAAAATKQSRVIFKGSGSYSLRYVEKSGEAFSLSASFKFRTVIPTASFTEGLAGARDVASLHASSYSGSWTASVSRPSGTHLCHGSGRFGNPAHGTQAPALRYTWSSHTGRFQVEAFNGLPGNRLRTTTSHADDCSDQLSTASAGAAPSSDFWRDWVWQFSDIGGTRHDLLDARFGFPGSLLSGRSVTAGMTVEGSSFPGACRTLGYQTCTQSYNWSGAVQFSRIG